MAKENKAAYRKSDKNFGGKASENKASFQKKDRSASGLANKQSKYRS